jgi:hypothetical protein
MTTPPAEAKVMQSDRLGWHVPDNLRWLAGQPERPDYMPCGVMTGVFLQQAAARYEEMARASTPSASADAQERARQAVAEILANDPVCGGRICSGTDQAIVEAVGRVLAPSASAEDLVEAIKQNGDWSAFHEMTPERAYAYHGKREAGWYLVDGAVNLERAIAALTEARAGEKG